MPGTVAAILQPCGERAKGPIQYGEGRKQKEGSLMTPLSTVPILEPPIAMLVAM